MSKIVCDVCGTSYPDTATQCPICGCVRSADIEALVSSAEGTEPATASSYTYVKGGRFSKTNVKKRNSGKPVTTASAPSAAKTAAQVKREPAEPKQKSNLGLIVVIVVLLLAIVAVLSYIAIRFIVPNFSDSDTGTSQNDPAISDDSELDAEPEDQEVPCTGLSISDTEVILISEGEVYPLSVILAPVNTTDVVTYESEDELIATIDADGMITAVAAGETVVTVTCGDQTAQCTVICDFAAEEPDEELVLDAEEHTFTAKGETWLCYTGTIPVEDITWTSDNESVATVTDGVVTAVGSGTTNIYAEYNDQIVSCAILCSDTVDTTEATDTTTPTESTNQNEGDSTTGDSSATANENYRFNTSDKNEAMIKVGEKFDLRLLDENGNSLSGVKFSSSNSNVCTVSESGRIKGIAYGNITITAEYNGAVYKCKIYVR